MLSKSDFAVIFDVDGVLINTLGISTTVTKKVMAEYGVDFDELIDPTGGKHHGESARTMLKNAKEQFGIDIDEREFLNRRAPHVRKMLLGSNIVVDQDLIKLLLDLKSHNVPVAVASNGIKEVTHIKLELLGVKEHFDVVITADDVSEHKPNPAPYLLAAKKLDVDPAKCVVIEDSVVGIKAGLAANMKAVAFLKHNKDTDNLESLAVSLVVDDWQDLSFEILKDLFV